MNSTALLHADAVYYIPAHPYNDKLKSGSLGAVIALKKMIIVI